MPAAALPPRRNIELKARLRSYVDALEIARRVATSHVGLLVQRDTYFRASHGRLKLRRIMSPAGARAELIWYARPDAAGGKASDYLLCPTPEPDLLEAALTAAHGVLVVVEKNRELFLWHNVRIHLDRVANLGDFLEFEAVLGAEADDAQGLKQVEELAEQFGILPEDRIAGSYSDLLAAANKLARGSPR